MSRLPVEVRRRLRSALPRILACVPAAEHGHFKRSVRIAVRIFFDTRRPKGVSDELQSLLATLNDPGADVVKVWQTLSPYAKKLVCQTDELAGHLPDPNAVTADDFRRELSMRVIRGERCVQGKRQRRRKTQIVGGRGRGRPADSDVDILVSMLASGYAAATGKPTTKSWSLPGDPTDFERILVLVFSAVSLPAAGYATKHALDRHMRERRRLEETSFQAFSEV